VSSLAKVGPVRNHGDLVMGVIRSPQTVVHFVTLLEEMPVQESLDGIHDLRETGVPVGAVIVNMERPALLSADELAKAGSGGLDLDEIARGLKSAGLENQASEFAAALVEEAAEHAQRTALERREKARLEHLPRYELPFLTDGMDLAGLYDLAKALREQGAA
jgi:hypothetical protein